MGLPAIKHRSTVEAYLAAEAVSEEKHEFHDGEILVMSGGTFEHSAITINLAGLLLARLQGTTCRPLDSNMRVRPGVSTRYFYPDLSVICGPPAFDPLDRQRTTITNPKVIVEVLSESTAAYDRDEKFTLYRESDTLEEYVLVSQVRPDVQTFLRQPDGTWSFAAYAGREATARLRSLDIDLPLAAVYAGVAFEQRAEPGTPGE